MPGLGTKEEEWATRLLLFLLFIAGEKYVIAKMAII